MRSLAPDSVASTRPTTDAASVTIDRRRRVPSGSPPWSRRAILTALRCMVAMGMVVVALVGSSPAGAQPTWVEPVDAPVVDGFRPPSHVGAPGNRGWEYATVPGTTVVAAGAGVVAFAGPVAGTLVVTIAHPDGTRTTYTHLGALGIEVGAVVSAGDPVGVSGDRLHFGVRDGAEYLDPGALFVDSGAGGTDASVGLRLVAVDGPVGPAGGIVRRVAVPPARPGTHVAWALLR